MGIEFNSDLKLQNLTTGAQTTKTKKSAAQNSDIAAALKKLGGTNKSDIEKAKAKLDNIKASNGMTYKEAKAKISEIEKKYFAMSKKDGLGGVFADNNNPYLKRVDDGGIQTPDGTTLMVARFHYEVDGNSLPEPDKTEYRRAKAAVEEIERNNSALVSDAKQGFNIRF